MDGEKTEPFKWTRPEEVMKIHQLKKKKKALQARINPNKGNVPSTSSQRLPESIKRQNPFATSNSCKRMKKDYSLDAIEDSDNTIFKLLHCTSQTVTNKENRTSFANILSQPIQAEEPKPVEVVRGEPWMPIDWTLKTKVRFLSSKPLGWSQKKKISEEASALTGFSRCLDTRTTTTSLDTSSNAKFHQCCLYWQQPCLPWLQLFPRTSAGKISSNMSSFVTNQSIKDSLHLAYTDGLKSLFQLLRTRQCAYFYVCTNTFTVLFRAAGIGGFGEMHAMVTPTTRGFRQVLRQEDIEFKLPFKKGRTSDLGGDTLDSTSNFESKDEDIGNDLDEDDMTDEQWLKDMGIQSEDIKKINFTQERIQHKVECEVDNSAQSLVFIEGVEVPSFFNFLMNCKSIIPQIGPLAGVPPTLLAPVAFNGASVQSLKVRENKVNVDNETFFSLELAGPILPHMIHNLYHLCQPEENVTASFTDLKSTQPFCKMKFKDVEEKIEEKESENVMTRSGSAIFKKENLADCGFSSKVLESFCNEEPERVTNYECLKYCSKLKLYNWL